MESIVAPPHQHHRSVPETYAGRTLFITGATGFMGKVLVEKLLRDCGDLKCIYVLIRTKKGVDAVQRRDDYLKHMIFDRVRQTNRDQLDKIKLIRGDILGEGLNISDTDRTELIELVDVVFHCAANVRFDQELKHAVNFNTKGAMRVLKMAEQMKRLKAFVHVSTAYCQCNEEVVEERGYSAPHNPLGISKLTELVSSDVLQMVTPNLLSNLPNTYAYSKALTEDLVCSYGDRLPIAIARPTIVVASWKEPTPGWIEGTNGPTGLMIGAGRGVIRSMHCNPDYETDLMPVDVTMNAIIVLGAERINNTIDRDVMFCNVSGANMNPVTWGEALETGRKKLYENPLCFALWYPDGSIKSNYYYHMLCVILFHYLPAYIIDFLMVVLRRKPFMVKVQKKITQGLEILQYYTTKVWVFKNDNMLAMYSRLSEQDREKFYFDMSHVHWPTYFLNYILGVRQFVLKEPPETLPKARRLLRKLYILDKVTQIMFYMLLLWLVWSYWSLVLGSIQFVFDTGIEYARNVMFPKRNGAAGRV
ncbi:putative fatty acyl-CoA reductase CG5065 [Topomyia yanbarensis]|uniref:putative fatty acyl-CoA reductase CG5065 n=1 Tax=Topomyia yanbarensis TaxID=2498891 RepID=UPI00273CC833|nr:putative fatty acyl-CoA reductase CG5065 [Topomyia yanbarensis]XP_058823562.1 putative fatty acyl-CoA reductase CG5065 [Topomyia yanbarensis]